MHTKTHLIHQNQDQNDYQNNASISEQEAEMERINYKLSKWKSSEKLHSLLVCALKYIKNFQRKYRKKLKEQNSKR